ncbi:thiosulfate oxidation carrier complex protein SoxZ [Candidatus Sulfurimonas baltica]|uniref:Thiosulfate oxidation carrier complex protein SoxZ n=1 Tax=Candidatus Sulfurimonas baltica TaxID=2740404 RepID=A0A7S7RN25_9BACT|nr:thiosulfate oxidation carrier complex protein SoxZ [Candidatus Sulfurimonas baltica]QOY52076.1 thiosulfate oxidation carrier complex protein SoxZ [Candidatus Sulfurimonas baltica]
MKVKAKLKKGVVEVKVLAKSPMAGKEEAKLKKINVEFITHMTAKLNGTVVWEASTGPFLSKDPYFQFSFTGAKEGDTIDIDWVNNLGKTAKASKKVK